MVGRVGPFGFRDELDQMVLRVPHRIAFTVLALVHAGVEDRAGVAGVLVHAFAVAPLRGGQEQVHREVFLAVRGRTVGVRYAAGVHRPGEVALVQALGHEHVFHDPTPQLVEHVLAAVLHGDHHRVAHALGAHVVVAGVHHVPQAFVVLPVDLVRAFEHLIPVALQAGLDGLAAVAALFEQAGLGSVVIGHCRSPCIRDSCVLVVQSAAAPPHCNNALRSTFVLQSRIIRVR